MYFLLSIFCLLFLLFFLSTAFSNLSYKNKIQNLKMNLPCSAGQDTSYLSLLGLRLLCFPTSLIRFLFWYSNAGLTAVDFAVMNETPLEEIFSSAADAQLLIGDHHESLPVLLSHLLS